MVGTDIGVRLVIVKSSDVVPMAEWRTARHAVEDLNWGCPRVVMESCFILGRQWSMRVRGGGA
jgi:hypothetical protein